MIRIGIKTFGCSHNLADSETMAHYLLEADFDVFLANAEDELLGADLIVYNTCTVKNPTDDKFFVTLSRTKKPVIIAGCIPQSQEKESWLKEYSAVGVEQLHKIVEAVTKTLQGEIVHYLERGNSTSRDFVPVIKKNSLIAIIPILQGCLGGCVYCKTKQARGNLKSYAPELILRQIRQAKLQGCKEVWLVSEDNGAYGLDIQTTLPALLQSILEIKGDFKVRIGMLNPQYAYKYQDELIKLLEHDRFFKFLHIPVQAGNNDVLKKMRRVYTVEEFSKTILALRVVHSDITIATDIICGFPTETKSQFEDTMKMVKELRFSIINISKFYPRPGTLAAKMKLLPTKEVKARSKELSDWFAQTNENKQFEGKELIVLFDEVGHEKGSFIGRTENYRQVIVHSTQALLGKKAKVFIKSSKRDYLLGTLRFILSY